MLKTIKSVSENMKQENKDERISDTEEVDLPSDFFDDFSNKEFMDGLEIIDEVGKDKIDNESSNDLEEISDNDNENSKSNIKRQESNTVINKLESSKRNDKSKSLSHKRSSTEKSIRKPRLRSPIRERISTWKRRKSRNYDVERYRSTPIAQKSRYRKSRSPKKPTFLEELAQTFAAQGKSFPELEAVKNHGFSGNSKSVQKIFKKTPVYSAIQQPTYDQHAFYNNMQHQQQMHVFTPETFNTTFPYSVESQTCAGYPSTQYSNSYDKYSFQQYPINNAIVQQSEIVCAPDANATVNPLNNSNMLIKDTLEDKKTISIKSSNPPAVNLAQTISRLTNISSTQSQNKQEFSTNNDHLEGKRKVSSIYDNNNIESNKPKQQKIGLAELLEASLLAQSLEKTNTEISKVDRVHKKVTNVIKHLIEMQHSLNTPLTFNFTPTCNLLGLNKEKLNCNENDTKSSTIENTKPSQRAHMNIPLSFSSGESSQIIDKSICLVEKLGININEINGWTRKNKDTLMLLFENKLKNNSNQESIKIVQKNNCHTKDNSISIMTQTTPGYWIAGTKNSRSNHGTQTVIGIGSHTGIMDSLLNLNYDQLKAVNEFINMIQWTEPVTCNQVNNLRNRLMSCYEMARSGWQCPSFQNDYTNRNTPSDQFDRLNNSQDFNNFNNMSNNPLSIILESLAYSSNTNCQSTYGQYNN